MPCDHLLVFPVPLQHRVSLQSFSWTWYDGRHPFLSHPVLPSLPRSSLPQTSLPENVLKPILYAAAKFILLISCHWNVTILHGMYVCMCVCMCVYIFLILRLAVDMLHSLTQLLPCRSSRYYSFIHHLCSSKLYTKLTLERSTKGNRGKSPVLRVTLSWVQVLTPLLTEYTLHGPFF